MPERGHQNGLLELHLAVLLFGGTALFSKLIPLNAADITLFRCVVAAMALAILVKVSTQTLSLTKPKDYKVALVLGTLVCAHWVTYFAAMQLSTVAIGMIAFYTYPVMTVLIEPLLNKQRIQAIDVMSAIAVLIGVILLIPEANLNNDITLGIIVGICSAALFTARNLIHKKHFSQYGGAKAMFYQTVVAVFILLPWQQTDLSALSQNTWLMLVILGVFFTAAPHALFASALRKLSAKTVSLVSCLQPCYGAILALLLLNEGLSSSTMIGGLIIVATAMFETMQHQQKKKA
ncbi:DMT family transporter [Shewanella intestini]|uniref:EamA family transporter n=1 Tax=Shewanella intestini TaxID=2017544 RepID=A0ABS5I0X6_9GAMM|nr:MULTISPECIES: DMT family transporter [Shewanella]MBR9727677.1 EamA family transporter [Shewanella intestini]MRG35173.1 EamA family transporter [Shewanella sp. XMDDZSB0408]